jgi:hypothetical protein
VGAYDAAGRGGVDGGRSALQHGVAAGRGGAAFCLAAAWLLAAAS